MSEQEKMDRLLREAMSSPPPTLSPRLASALAHAELFAVRLKLAVWRSEIAIRSASASFWSRTHVVCVAT